MIQQKLHDNWKMKKAGDSGFLPAKVPGSVYGDLLFNKKMEDPYWRDNEDKAFALLENDFEYVNTFKALPSLFGCDRVLLRCEGLDTLADLYLNGFPVGKADNMHRTWEFDVKQNLRKGDNDLRVVFHSPIKFVRDAYKKVRTDGSDQCLDGFPQLRKAHCMFGWDWGPRLPDAGIWRDIKLVGIKSARINNVYLTQKHKAGSVDLNVQVALDVVNNAVKTDELRWGITLTDPRGKETVYEKSPKKINHLALKGGVLNPSLTIKGI
jgi:beta-mannosidase